MPQTVRVDFSTSWTAVALAVALALPSGACKKSSAPPAPPPPAQLALTPVSAARVDLVAEVTMPRLDATFATVGAMAKKLGLPFSDTDLRTMLVTKTELPAAIIDKLDTSKPAAAAVIVLPKASSKPGAAVGQGAVAPKPGAAGQDASAPEATSDSPANAGDTHDNADDSPDNVVLAVGLKDGSPAGFAALTVAAGKVVERDHDAVRIAPGDGGAASKLWLVAREGSVCASETREGLIKGCALAIAARRASANDLRVSLYPEGFARAMGTTVAAGLAKLRADMVAQQAQAAAMLGGKTDPALQAASGKVAQAVVGFMLDAVADTTEVRMALTLDADKGLANAVELVPRAGSPFAKMVAPRRAYAVDPALLAGEAPAGLWAMGDVTLGRAAWNAVQGPLLEIVPEADRAKLSASTDAMMNAFEGPWGARFAFLPGAKLSFQYDLVYGLKPGSDGKALLASMEDMMKAPWLTRFFEGTSAGMMKVKLQAKRDGEALVTRFSFDNKALPKEMRAQFKGMPFFDGTPMEARTLVAADRMLVSTGPQAKPRLAAMVKPVAGAPTGDFAAALEDTKGEDGLYYTDLGAVLRPALAFAAGSPMARGQGPGPGAMLGMAGALLANAQLGTWASYRGGDTATFTWRVPMTTFESVGTIVRGVMGSMGMGGK